MELTKEQELMQRIINEAWENETFKQELVANPVVAIEKLTGEKVRLPEGKQLVARDQTNEETIYINIPAEQNLDDVELNEEQLEAVAGGAGLMGVINPDPLITLFNPKKPILKYGDPRDEDHGGFPKTEY